MINFYHRLDNSCCYLLFFLFGLSNCLRIRGYFITHPRLREVFALFLWLIACMGLAFLILLFLFLLTQISQISRNLLPSLFLFHAKRSSPPEGAKGNLAKNAKISFIAGFLVSHRSHESHESIHRLRSYVPSG